MEYHTVSRALVACFIHGVVICCRPTPSSFPGLTVAAGRTLSAKWFSTNQLQQQPFAVLVSQSTQDQHSKLVGTFVGEQLAEALVLTAQLC